MLPCPTVASSTGDEKHSASTHELLQNDLNSNNRR